MSGFISECNVQATEVKLEQVNFNAEFISRMIPRLEWPAICQAAESVRCNALYTVYELYELFRYYEVKQPA